MSGAWPSLLPMCRSIVQLRRPEGASREELEAAARQFVRKISGFREPARHNRDVFEDAVTAVADTAERLLAGLVVRGST